MKITKTKIRTEIAIIYRNDEIPDCEMWIMKERDRRFKDCFHDEARVWVGDTLEKHLKRDAGESEEEFEKRAIYLYESVIKTTKKLRSGAKHD